MEAFSHGIVSFLNYDVEKCRRNSVFALEAHLWVYPLKCSCWPSSSVCKRAGWLLL